MPAIEGLDDSCLQTCVVGSALEGMCVGLIITNNAGRVVWMNRSAQSVLGIGEAEARGELLGKLLRDPGMAEFWHRASEAGDVAVGEVELHWPRACQLKTNASRCYSGKGESIGRVLLFCDVTQEHSLRLELSQEATQRLLDMAEGWQADREARPQSGLTAQELRTLRGVGSGLSNEEIARQLHVAPSTVRTHLKHCYAKLKLASRAEAIAHAIRHGLA